MSNEHYAKLQRMYSRAPINEFYQPIMVVGEGVAEIEMEPNQKRSNETCKNELTPEYCTLPIKGRT